MSKSVTHDSGDEFMWTQTLGLAPICQKPARAASNGNSFPPRRRVEGCFRGFQKHALTSCQALARGRQSDYRCGFEAPCRQHALQRPLFEQPRAIPFGSRDNSEAVDRPVSDHGAVVRRQCAVQPNCYGFAYAFARSIVLSETQTAHVIIVFS